MTTSIQDFRVQMARMSNTHRPHADGIHTATQPRAGYRPTLSPSGNPAKEHHQ